MRPHVCSLLLLVGLLLPAAALAQFAVGTADVTYNDPDRDGRPVPVDLYYPATADGANQPVADPPAGGFATVAIGHGYQMSAGVYGWLAEELARIGCVVAVPRTGGELFPSHGTFGLDLAFAARTLRDAGDDDGSPFFGRMSDRALLMGHSMGGGASLLGLAGDPSLTGVANFAAAETNPSAIAACGQIDRPALLFAGTNDCVTPPADHQVPMYDALAGGWRALVTLDGASHCQFAEYSFICSLGEFCSADISRTEQHDRVWFLLEPWVRAIGLGDQAQAQVFQERLETSSWLAFEQAGAIATAAPPPTDLAPRLAVAPNPFNPITTVQLELPADGSVSLRLFDARGRLVRDLATGDLRAGRHDIRWDGRDQAGRNVAAGIYLARLESTVGQATARLVLVR